MMPLSPGEYIRKIVRWILERPVRILSDRFSSFPDQNDVSRSLTNLYNKIQTEKNSKGLVLDIDPALHSIVILSDHHKGARNGSDDFSALQKIIALRCNIIMINNSVISTWVTPKNFGKTLYFP
jgi:hypothetical protein